MRARAPASSANLGPGFDTLALAVDRYVEVEIEPAQRLSVRSEGEGAGLSDDAGHLAARVAIDVAGHDHMAITVRSQIPIARGLGSSAALAAAAAAAARSPDPLAVAAALDGHPENAAACVQGGLVVATGVRGSIQARRLPLDPALVFVALVPDRSLSTAKARQLLPATVSRDDATFNLGRMGLLLAGLADHRLLAREATEDRLHQDYRSPLFPEAPKLLGALLEAGALASCWSGAGSTLLGICTDRVGAQVREAGEAAMRQADVPGTALLLHADLRGLMVGEGRMLSVNPDAPRATPGLFMDLDRDGEPDDAAPATQGGALFDFDEDG
jgi:homoserine kinase